MKRIALLIALSSLLTGSSHAQQEAERFVDSLMRLMTLEEKIGQMTLYTSEWDQTGPTMRPGFIDDIRHGRCGNIFNAYTAGYTRKLQEIAVRETRLKIPLLFGYDVIHGHRTIFPIPLAESCSWDLDAIQRAAGVAAAEAAAEGLHWTFAPMVDVARDPRWGRIAEGAGEDTYLGSLIAAARVKGFQGQSLADTNTVAACAKHFAAYGAAQGGRDYNIVDISEHTLHETYLPPFEACVKAGAATFMTSFNEINGIPSTGNPWLLDTLLKGRWNYNGVIVTDYTSINEMIPHGFAKDEEDAARLSVNAGVDMDMMGATFSRFLEGLIQKGQVDPKRVDASVKRILMLKYQLGLFQDPFRYYNEQRQQKVSFSEANRKEARDMAARSMVLLKNEGSLLPLSRKQKIALIGPLAKDQRNLIGNWSAAGDWKQAVSVYEGLLQALGNRQQILYAKGCDLLDDPNLILQLNQHGGNLEQDKRGWKVMQEEALRVASQADVLVVVLGEAQGMTGEAASRSDIGLPAPQVRLLKALAKTGKPIVLVLMNGRPLTLEWEAKNIPAILEAWFAGSMTGHAVADVLLGKFNPSAKLTTSFPRSVGQIPVYYNMKNTGRPRDPNSKYTSKYLDTENDALFPFGYGLSYSRFQYGKPVVSQTSFRSGERVTVTVTVANAGTRDGEEIVQCYIRDHTASLTRPLKELKAYQKVKIPAGTSRTLQFTLGCEEFSFLDKDLKTVCEPGRFSILIGPNSRDVQEVAVELLPDKP